MCPPLPVSLPPVATNHHQASPDIDPASLKCEEQVLRPSRKILFQEDGALQPNAGASRGSVDLSKISKAAKKTKLKPRSRLHSSQEAPSGGPLSFSIVNTTEPQPLHQSDIAAPRRSTRLKQLVPSAAENPANTVSTDHRKGAVQSKSERKLLSNPITRIPPKPRGILKKQSVKTVRWKASVL